MCYLRLRLQSRTLPPSPDANRRDKRHELTPALMSFGDPSVFCPPFALACQALLGSQKLAKLGSLSDWPTKFCTDHPSPSFCDFGRPLPRIACPSSGQLADRREADKTDGSSDGLIETRWLRVERDAQWLSDAHPNTHLSSTEESLASHAMELMTSSFPANSRQSKKTCIQCRQRKVTPLPLTHPGKPVLPEPPPVRNSCPSLLPSLSPLLLTSLLHVMKANSVSSPRPNRSDASPSVRASPRATTASACASRASSGTAGRLRPTTCRGPSSGARARRAIAVGSTRSGARG